MLAQGQTGTINSLDGQQPTVRTGRTGELIATQAHGRFYEQTSRTQIFTLAATTVTTNVALGNQFQAGAAGVGLANQTTNFALWNPVGSGINLCLLKWTYAPLSATTLSGGPGFHGVFVNGNPTNSTTADSGRNAFNNLIGGKQPLARYINTVAGTAITGGTAPSLLRPMINTYSAAAFASAAGTPVTENIDGDIVIPPGYGWVPLFYNAFTALIASFTITWEEVPI